MNNWPNLLARAVLSLFLLVSPAHGYHRWLDLEPFISQSPGMTRVYYMIGDRLFQEVETYPERNVRQFAKFAVYSSTGERSLSDRLREDSQPLAYLAAADLGLGTAVLALETVPVDYELPSAKFQSYLFEERLTHILTLRAARNQEDQPGRERYSRYLKAIVQVGSRMDSVAQRPVGHALEIVPLLHPYEVVPGATLPVQVLFQGQPLVGCALTAANRYHHEVLAKTTRTDVNGKAVFRVDRPGAWLLTVVYMHANKEAKISSLDWRSYYASLTFFIPEPVPRAS